MKKQRIAVISRKENRATYDSASSIVTALQKQSTSAIYTPLFFEDLLFAYDGKKLRITEPSGQDISDFDSLFLTAWFKNKMLDDTALSVAMYATAHGMPYHNSEAGANRSNSKLSQYVIAALHQIQIAPFVFALDVGRLLQGIDAANLEYPMIIKSVRGARGNDNYLVHSRSELHDIVSAHPDVQFIAQAFVPNDGDYRLVVMGGTVHVALYRQSQTDSHLNNTSKGAKAHAVAIDTLPADMLSQSIGIAKALNREITGVDMVIHKETGRHYFLEANNMPQLSTGSFVALKIAALDTFLTSQGAKKYD